MQYFRQCVLAKGATRQVAYIPEEFAVKGDYLRLRDEDGWLVDEVSGLRVNGRYLNDYKSSVHRDWRSVTDI